MSAILPAELQLMLDYIRQHPSCSVAEMRAAGIFNQVNHAQVSQAMRRLEALRLISKTSLRVSPYRYLATPAGSSSGKTPGLGPGERGSSPRPATNTKEGER